MSRRDSGWEAFGERGSRAITFSTNCCLFLHFQPVFFEFCTPAVMFVMSVMPEPLKPLMPPPKRRWSPTGIFTVVSDRFFAVGLHVCIAFPLRRTPHRQPHHRQRDRQPDRQSLPRCALECEYMPQSKPSQFCIRPFTSVILDPEVGHPLVDAGTTAL